MSMTDMTVSFLFIVMVLLAFFASQLRDPKSVTRAEYDKIVQERDKLQKEVRELQEQLKRLINSPVEKYLADVADKRRLILKDLQAKLRTDFPDLEVVISDEMDALRFKGDGLFKTGSSELRPDKRRIVESIATHLEEVLPCYTLGARSSWDARCNAPGAVIEAVLIEGHTDSDGQDNSNVTLSTNRANETFFAMTKHEPGLVDYLNERAQPVLSVAGYGRMRPVVPNLTSEKKATNRRIDLRIIMYTPSTLDQINHVREDLRKRVTGESP